MPSPDDKIVCYCYAVTKGEIQKVIDKHKLLAVGDVTWYTGAGGGCGGCRMDIQGMLDQQTRQSTMRRPGKRES
jgi:NifU-like protein